MDGKPVPSPCIGVCTIDDDSGFCLGCARSLAEVSRWRGMTPARQAEVLAELPARKRRMEAAGVEYRWRSC